MSIPEDIIKRQTVAAYIKEAVQNLRDQDLLKLRMKEIKDVVKDSELIDPKEFASAVAAAYDSQKHQEKIDALQAGIDLMELLGL